MDSTTDKPNQARAKNILVVGLPETGKSSFIQALDEVLKHPRSAADLCSCGLAQDRSYIQSGKAEFLAGKKLTRTTRPLEDTAVELWFEHRRTGQRGRLHLPDVKGEVFQDQWVHRQWEQNYRSSLSNISGALIFVRADGKARNDELLGTMITQPIITGQSLSGWEMKHASAQVQLVDVLQFIMDYSDVPRPLRSVVLISAWDTVGGAGDLRPKDPSKFLEREWALVAQYLKANPECFEYRTYGVSAYGGEPNHLGAMALKPAHERVTLTYATVTDHDITRPIRWLLGLEEGTPP
jgi:hypothetical protein